MTALRLLITLVLLCAPFVLYVAATIRGKADNGLWLIFPVVMAIPSGLGGLFVLAPLEAILDARGGGHLKNVILPIAGGALVFVVLGTAWIRGRRRRAALAAKRNAPVRTGGRQELWVFAMWCVVGVIWGALWRASEPIAQVILTGTAEGTVGPGIPWRATIPACGSHDRERGPAPAIDRIPRDPLRRSPRATSSSVRRFRALAMRLTRRRAAHGVAALLVAGSMAAHARRSASASPSPRPVTGSAAGPLRVCADPNNLPFSDRAGRGFENRIAETLGAELHRPVAYTWFAQRRGFVRNTLRAGLCDVVIGAPAGDEQLQTTAPYYASTYAFVTRRADHWRPTSFDDPGLRTRRVGIHVVGDDYANVPPGAALTRRGIVRNVVGFSIYGDYRKPSPPSALIDAVAQGTVDVAIAWGPLAGYFAKHARVPLDVTPVPNDGPSPAERFVYPIAMGVRKGDDSLHVALERAVERRRSAVDRILAEYGVPIVGAAASGSADDLAYVTNEGGRMLSVISTATDRVIASIPVGLRPRGVRIRPDGRTLFVALSGSPRCPPTMSDADCAAQRADRSKDGIAVIDAAARRVTRILPGGVDPEQFDLTPDGRWLVAANEDVGLASIVDVPSGRIVAQLPVGGEPEGVRVSRDGATAYVTSEAEHRITAIDLARRTVRGQATVDARPRDLALMPDGRRYWASAEVGGTVSLVDGATGRVLRRITMPNGAKPMGLALAPDGNRLYVATGRGGTVEVVDTRTGRITASVKVGARPWGIALTRDGRKLYVANGPSNDVSVVDTQRLRVTATIAVGALPWGIAIGPAAH